MTSRAEIEKIIRDAYAARARNDVEGTFAAFHPDCDFRLNGRGTGAAAMNQPFRGQAAVRQAIGSLIAAFRFEDWKLIDLIVEGDLAAVHWRAKVTCNATGRFDEFDVIDKCRLKDGKVIEFLQSYDSALAKKISA